MISKEGKKKLLLALKEDIAGGDVSSELIARENAVARIVAKEKCVVSGLEEAAFLFRSKGLKVKVKGKDGAGVKKGRTVLEVSGEDRKILSVERTTLNVIGRMSGISSATSEAIARKGKGKSKIACTRKTVPGFNEFDKKAVELGGGWRHRKNLNEAIMLKDNHWKFIEDLGAVVKRAKKRFRGKKIEVEVQNAKHLQEAIESRCDVIMLDNFSVKKARKAIKEIRAKNKRVKIELSGGINMGNLRKYGKLGADFISLGELTHSVKGKNFSLEIKKVN